MYWNFQEELSSYVFIILSMHKTRPNDIFLGIQDYFYMTQPTLTQKSNVKYHSVMDAIADTKDTMMAMLHQLHEEYIITLKQTYLDVEGDAKLFEIFQSLKHEYGQELKWLIPYPGD